ncbi:hypothetical protein [Streptomyces sp. NPDC088847]|uniref:hypothetical protein n=1 Tax=Streptomyces sp. NPDC088847 TaxID=3365909 RepID=UPI0038072931
MTRKMRRCAECRVPLPRDAGQRRRYCDTTCRSRQWRRVKRHDEIYRRVMSSLNAELGRDGFVWGQGRCPACGVSVSVRKRTDSVYCSPKCRTRAWRLRRESSA